MTRVDFRCCPFTRKTPDLSMCPNIKELDLNGCVNLVEIENSVGRLDRLVVGDMYGLCFSLRTSQLPCMELDLSGCENLVQIENSVGRLDRLVAGDKYGLCFSLRISQLSLFRHLGIRGLYTSCQNLTFGNLIGLRELYIGKNGKPCHLPGSIYNLQHIETLQLHGNFIFPRDVEIDRQPLCNSLGGFSKYVFPSLKNLFLYYFSIQSEMDFILNYCCPVTLETLDFFSDCNYVTLPESISRCERLHSLHIPIGKFLGFHEV